MKRKALDIRRRDLRQLLDEVADRGHAVAAEKRRTLVQTMFRWALRQDIVENDPSAGLSPYGQTSARKRVLDLDEIGKLWDWLSGGGMPPHIADILRLQICLGARVGEVAGMVAPEFERDASGRLLWRLPAQREKDGHGTPHAHPGAGAGHPRAPAQGRARAPVRVGARAHSDNVRRRRGGHQSARENADREMGQP
jgi:integrase